ncbi:hypothetical protein [Tabrizicola sp. TH137]|uniref:hypothetical protein n=1 Tax=Tabrizicola sp. TH137 TaxID=2067452 RepID=UPI00117E507A|nr:hypothetical protein [Tabrizicola sp. TH137]
MEPTLKVDKSDGKIKKLAGSIPDVLAYSNAVASGVAIAAKLSGTVDGPAFYLTAAGLVVIKVGTEWTRRWKKISKQ